MSFWRSYLIPKSFTTIENGRGKFWCRHRPGVMGYGSYPNLDICSLSLSLAIFIAWGNPYKPFWISIYTKRLCAKFMRLCCCTI